MDLYMKGGLGVFVRSFVVLARSEVEQMKIGLRLTLGFGVLIVLLISLAAVSIFMVDAVNTELTEITEVSLTAEKNLGPLMFAGDYEIHMAHHYIEGTGVVDGSTKAAFLSYQATFEESLENLTELHYTSSDEAIHASLTKIDNHHTTIVGAIAGSGTGMFDNYDDYMEHSDIVHNLLPAIIAEVDDYLGTETNDSCKIALLQMKYNLDYAIHMMHHYTEGETTGIRSLYTSLETSIANSMTAARAETSQGAAGVSTLNGIEDDIDTLHGQVSGAEGVFFHYDNMMEQSHLVHETFPKLLAEVLALQEIIGEMADASAEAAQTSVLITFSMVSLTTVVSIVVAIVVALYTTRSLTKPMNELADVSERIAKGDLSVKLQATAGEDEIGILTNSFHEVIEFLRPTVEQINQATLTLASSAQELASSSEEVNASSEEISSISQQMSRGAQEQTTKVVATLSMSEDLKTMFQEKMKGITRTSDVIANINSEINMLALNASIEAARAGEYGRGFAVVADSIRNLAEETNTSLKSIQSVIDEIYTSLNSSIDGITNSISDVANISEETASGAEEASASTEEQAATMEELSATAQDLAAIASSLEELVKRFKLT